MKGRFNTRQRNYIILGLCSILLIMAAGYAAFRTQLNINGTSNITSEWKVLITNIQSKVLSGTPTDAETPSHTETMAKFSTKLVSPGDSMQYNITVENQGDIDAVLEGIDVKTAENAAIIFETSGIKRGDKLLPDESDILTLTVTYNPEVTDQPSSLNSEVIVTLNYVQDDGTIESEPVDITDNVITSGDGLYNDEYNPGRYVYRGANPNNYIEFNGELWRIISKEADGTYKILRNEVLPEEMPFDSAGARTTGYCSQGYASDYGCNAWSSTANMVGSPSEFRNGDFSGSVDVDSEMLTYLNVDYYNSLRSEARGLIVNHDYNIGGVTYGNDNFAGQLNDERSYKWNGKVGLISLSDYINANSDMESCGSLKSVNGLCRNSNWMFISGKWWWTLSSVIGDGYDNVNVWIIRSNGQVGSSDGAFSSNSTRPVVFLSSSISLSGSGAENNPFRIN